MGSPSQFEREWAEPVERDGEANTILRTVAIDSGVPLEALMVLGYLQGRFEPPLLESLIEPPDDAEVTEAVPGVPEESDSIPMGYEARPYEPEGGTGRMRLSGEQCARAGALGVAGDCADDEVNVRAAAALLLDALGSRGVAPDTAVESDWEDALTYVIVGSGAVDDGISGRVERQLRRGFVASALSGEVFELRPLPSMDDDADPFGSSSGELVIPGGWRLSDAALRASASVSMSYEGSPPWNGGRNCGGRLLDGTRQLGDFVRSSFDGRVTSYGGYSCRPNTANTSQTSVHGTGRALDLFVPLERGQADNGRGDPVANWLVENAQAIGVQLVIWDRTIWSARPGGGRVRSYRGPHPHHDHLHVELTHAGARQETDWFRPRGCTLGAGIRAKYDSIDGPRLLGRCVDGEHAARDRTGSYAHFEHGSIFWQRSTGNAHVIRGAIRDRWRDLGWERGVLGYPISDETPTSGGTGAYSHFENGSIFWSRATGRAHMVRGAIRARWRDLGWERSHLGFPVADERASPDGRGSYSDFERGSIYWTPEHGAHEIYGATRNKWVAMGAERSRLGYPVVGERRTRDGRGSVTHFEHGSVFWTPELGAKAVYLAIRTRYAGLGYEGSRLGYPTSDEVASRDGRGAYSEFEHGAIYWSPEHGAHPVERGIYVKYRELGLERSFLGYPVSGEIASPDGRGAFHRFERGAIYWSPEHGAHSVYGAIHRHWESLGAEMSDMGYPTHDVRREGDREVGEFEGGTLEWTAATGVVRR